MVAVLPSRQLWTSALGEGLSRGIEQGTHRSLLQNALQKSETQLSNPNLNPTQQLFGLMKGLAGYPGAEKFIAPVFQELQRQKSLGSAASVASPLAAALGNERASLPTNSARMGSTAATTGRVAQQPQSTMRGSETSSLENAYQGLSSFNIRPPSQMSAEGSLTPTELGAGLIPPVFSPEQRMEERKKAAEKGIDPQAVDQVMDSWDKAAIQQADVAEKAAQRHAERSELRSRRQEQFRDNATKWLQKDSTAPMHPDDFQMFMQIAEQPEYERLRSDTERFRAAKKIFDIAQKNKHALIQLGKRPLFFSEEAEKHKKAVKNSVQPLVKLGQEDLARQIIQQELEYGPVTASKILNDLPPTLYKEMDKLPEYEAPGVELSPWEEIPQAVRKGDKIQKQWKSFLQKAVKPGVYTTENPNQRKQGTSLYILQDEAQKRGMPESDFFRLLHEMSENDEIELDDTQRYELTELSKPGYKRYGLPELLYQLVPGYKPKK